MLPQPCTQELTGLTNAHLWTHSLRARYAVDYVGLLFGWLVGSTGVDGPVDRVGVPWHEQETPKHGARLACNSDSHDGENIHFLE